ncbi:peptidoglycan-binding protein, partial [Virgibacillus sp. C22-A2]|nr:peptidoglycan-binding protein [Virgibacillus sp. C22-A2]
TSGFQQGERHPGIIDLKENLNRLGFGYISVTTLYGSYTEKKVKDFQAYYGLNVTGKVDTATFNKIDQILDSPFQINRKNEETADLKYKLNWIGYGNISVTELYGNFTELKVKQFQRDHNLPVSGIAEEMTIKTIDKVLEDIFQQGSKHTSIIELKNQLNGIGFGEISISDVYDNFTAQRVRELQNYYGLNVTGRADYDTLKKITSLVESPFQEGERHNDTIKLKENLNKLGFGYISISTLYGSFTEQQVRNFQDYYGLKVNGIADERTFQKIEEILSSPFQEGERHEGTIHLKENLNRLGFGNIKVTNLYGDLTARKVTEFQVYYGLRVNGIADDPTFAKINEVLASPLQLGKSHPDAIELKKDLNALGYDGISLTDYFGNWTDTRLRQFQADYDLPVSGIADEVTLAVLAVAVKATKYTKYDLSLKEALNIQMQIKDPPPQTDKKYAYVSSIYIKNNEVTASLLNVRSGPGGSKKIVGTLANGTKVNILSEVNGWYQIEFTHGQWVDASQDDVLYYLNPSNFIDDEKTRFQFLDLSRTSDTSVTILNTFLKGKGVLEGKGQAFIDASRIHGVSDVYLLSHALLETGNGTSPLAEGIEVGKDKDGKLVLVTSSNKNSLTAIKTTHNMFGIGAVDGNAYQGGAFRAYELGWFTLEDAIIGGARFIGNNYVKSGQNTLYKMRWNPAAMDISGQAAHQYATDIGWASKQINTMYNLYQDLGITNVYLDVPEYKK